MVTDMSGVLLSYCNNKSQYIKNIQVIFDSAYFGTSCSNKSVCHGCNQGDCG